MTFPRTKTPRFIATSKVTGSSPGDSAGDLERCLGVGEALGRLDEQAVGRGLGQAVEAIPSLGVGRGLDPRGRDQAVLIEDGRLDLQAGDRPGRSPCRGHAPPLACVGARASWNFGAWTMNGSRRIMPRSTVRISGSSPAEGVDLGRGDPRAGDDQLGDPVAADPGQLEPAVGAGRGADRDQSLAGACPACE